MVVVANTDPVSQLDLPPGFRFYPTDEELLVQYLCRKVAGHQFSLQIIGEVDLYKFDPWVLPSKAIFGEKEWYFFSPRDRKYPNGSRPNRVAGSGYWKATGTDKIITNEGRKTGIKKALVFYIGKAPKGMKTNWIMHEYRLSESTRRSGSSRLDEWVLCRIYKKNSGSGVGVGAPTLKPETSLVNKEVSNGSSSSSSSQFDDVLESLPKIDDRAFALPRVNSLKTFDWASLATMTALPEPTANGHNQIRGANDVYCPSIPPLCHVDSPSEKLGNSIEEEVESGFGSHRVDNSDWFQQTNGLPQPFCDSIDPFGLRYLTNPVSGRFGFGQKKNEWW